MALWKSSFEKQTSSQDPPTQLTSLFIHSQNLSPGHSTSNLYCGWLMKKKNQQRCLGVVIYDGLHHLNSIAQSILAECTFIIELMAIKLAMELVSMLTKPIWRSNQLVAWVNGQAICTIWNEVRPVGPIYHLTCLDRHNPIIPGKKNSIYLM